MASNALETQGVKFVWHDQEVGEVVSFSGPGGSASVIDVTHLGSTRREKRMGIPDEGQISFEVNLVPTDVGQLLLLGDRADRTKRSGYLYLTDTGGTILTFEGYCTQFSIQGSVDNKIQASVTIEITGEVNWSPLLSVQTAYNATTGVIVLDLSEDTFGAGSETNGNWTIDFASSGLTLTSVAKTSDTRATITLATGSGVAGDHTLTFQAAAAALAGSYPTGILSVDITIPT